MMAAPAESICVIVLNFSSVERTERCVRSLLGQGIDTLYVVDNSGEESQARVLEGVCGRLSAQGATFGIHLLINAENLGFGRGINRAVQMDLRSGGHDCYLLLNDDAMLPSRGAAGLLRQMNSREDVGLVSGKILADDREIRFLWYQRWFGHVSRKSIPGSFPYLPGACLLVHRSLLSNGQMFDEAFFMYGEDVALTWKTMQRGLTVACADEVEVVHEGSASSILGSYFYEYHVARGHVLLARRLARHAWEIPLMLVGRFAYLLPRAVLRALRSRSSVPLLAAVMAWYPMRMRDTRPGGL